VPPPPVEPVDVEIPVAPEQLGRAPAGCGCTASPAGGWLLFGLFALLRRKKR
jgi:MYXO-CTERM domain-containing protein